MRIQPLFTSLTALAITIGSAGAFQLDALLGSWSGKRKEIQNGVGMYAKATFKGTRLSDGGVLIVEKADTPTWGMVTARHKFHKDGKYQSRATVDFGLIIASSSGTWRKSNGDILIAGKSGNMAGTKKFSGRFKMTDKNKFSYSGISGDTRVILTGTRR